MKIDNVVALNMPSTIPVIGPVLIDKLAGVIDVVDKAYGQYVANALINEFLTGSKNILKVSAKGAYQVAAKIPFPDSDGVFTECLRIEVKNPKLKPSQVRVEYNPAKLTQLGESVLDVELEGLFGMSLKQLLHHVRFTRIDVCREIMDRKPEDYLFKGLWKTNSLAYFGGEKGVETLYLGKPGHNQICIYNKAQEQGLIHKDSVRIEHHVKVSAKHEGLISLPDPFAKLRLVSIECKSPPIGTAYWRAFQDSCRLRGINGAIM